MCSLSGFLQYRHLYGDDSSETLPMLKRAPVLDVVLPVLSLYSRGPVAFEFASHREQLRAEFQRLYRTDKFRGALTRASTAGGLKYARDMYEDSLRCVLPNLGPISTARKFPKEKELKVRLDVTARLVYYPGTGVLVIAGAVMDKH